MTKISVWKKISVISFIIFLFGCPLLEKTIIRNGSLPESAIALVPYKNGKSYKFKYSNDLTINFVAERERVEEIDNGCAECFNYELYYELDRTILKSDYPLFDIKFEIDNNDSTKIHCYSTIGNDYFTIPTNELEESYFEKEDSMFVDSVWYRNVFKMKSGTSSNNNIIYTDSLYYNYKFGIIKIIMSNGKTYTITQ